MTATQQQHYYYTTNEWNSVNHQEQLDIVFKNDDIKIIYDIGANVGGTANTFIEYCNRNNKNIEKIYCFEPDEENMDFLKLVLKNYIDNNKLECIQTGIYYGKTEAKVFGAGHVAENRIHPNVGGYGIQECMEEYVSRRNDNGENVFCAQIKDKVFKLDTLENLSKNFLQPDFIKIDVEGAEKNILMNSTIIKNAKFMIVEWNQKQNINDFINEYLPDFEVIPTRGGDPLLKNKNYK